MNWHTRLTEWRMNSPAEEVMQSLQDLRGGLSWLLLRSCNVATGLSAVATGYEVAARYLFGARRFGYGR